MVGGAEWASEDLLNVLVNECRTFCAQHSMSLDMINNDDSCHEIGSLIKNRRALDKVAKRPFDEPVFFTPLKRFESCHVRAESLLTSGFMSNQAKLLFLLRTLTRHHRTRCCFLGLRRRCLFCFCFVVFCWCRAWRQTNRVHLEAPF